MANSNSGLLRHVLVLAGPWHNLLLARVRAPGLLLLLLLILLGSGVICEEFRGVGGSQNGLEGRPDEEVIRSGEDFDQKGYWSNRDKKSFVVYRAGDNTAGTGTRGVVNNSIRVNNIIASGENSSNSSGVKNTDVSSRMGSENWSSSIRSVSDISGNSSSGSRIISDGNYSRTDESNQVNRLGSSVVTNSISSSNRSNVSHSDNDSISNNTVSDRKRTAFRRTLLNNMTVSSCEDSFLYNLLSRQRYRRSERLIDVDNQVGNEGALDPQSRENSRKSGELKPSGNDVVTSEDSRDNAGNHQERDDVDVEADYYSGYHAQVNSYSEIESNRRTETPNLSQKSSDDAFKQQMLLKMLRLERIPDLRPKATGTLPRQTVPEYVQALLHALDHADREDNVGVERLRNAGLDDQSIWAIQPFVVLQKDSRMFEALFHISLSYQPSAISKVELVLENHVELPSIDSHASIQADPNGWSEFLDYAQRRKAARSARWSVRSTCSVEVCDGRRDGNENYEYQKTVKRDFVGKIIASNMLDPSFETSGDSADEANGASIKLSRKGGVSVTHSPVESTNSSSRVLSRYSYNTTMENSKKLSQMSHSALATRRAKVSSEMASIEKCKNELSTKRRRLVGLDSDHDVLDVTKPFLSWWHECSSDVVCRNSSTACLNVSCTVRMKIRDISLTSPAGLGNNALLIIYKNLEADLSRTRRALRNLASEAKRVRRNAIKEVDPVSENKGGGRLSEIESEMRLREKRDLPRQSKAESFKAGLDSSYDSELERLKRKLYEMSKAIDSTLETSRDVSARTRHHIAKRIRRDTSASVRRGTVEEAGHGAFVAPRYRMSEKLRHDAYARTSFETDEKARYDVTDTTKRDDLLAEQSPGKEDAKGKSSSLKSSSRTGVDFSTKSSENLKLKSLSKINETTSRGKRIVPHPESTDEELKRCEKTKTCAVNKRNAVHVPASKGSASDPSLGYCGLRQWRINFEELGWNFVIAPNTVEVNYCEGSCIVAQGHLDAINLTNNAFLRLVYRVAKGRGKSDVGTDDLGSVFDQPPIPLCVPVSTAAVRMLYRQDDNTIVLKMVCV